MNSPPHAKELLAVMESPGTVESPDFLVRSRQEVIRLLNGIMECGAAISIHFLNNDRVAVSTLIDVDEPGNRLLLECPPDWRGITKINNDADSDSGGSGDSIMLACVLDDAKIRFQAGTGEIVDLDGTLAVALNIPDFMWRFQRRRDARRKVSGLKITLNLGFMEIDAEVADLGIGGVGVVNCDSELKLEAGEVLSGCAIALPGVGQIAVDLTVQHQTPMHLADGREVTRVGCQFTQLDDSARQLIAHCLEALAQA